MTRLIKFEAAWCNPCKKMQSIAVQIAKDHGVNLVVIDIEEDEATTLLYGVKGVPTLVMERDGDEVGRLVGAQPRRLAEAALGLA